MSQTDIKSSSQFSYSYTSRDTLKIFAAALHAPSYDEAICFAVDRPQSARFQGNTIRISISPGEPLWFGLATSDEFENWWRLRKKKQASK